MYIPQFPYVGNQAIITSGRVTIHSYDDFIFLFGKKGVAISSPNTFTVDANERTIITSRTIELGYRAERIGEPILLGQSTITQLGFLFKAIENLANALKELDSESLESSFPLIVQTAVVLEDTAKTVSSKISTKCLSKTTFSR
jgi:hypothetical protein